MCAVAWESCRVPLVALRLGNGFGSGLDFFVSREVKSNEVSCKHVVCFPESQNLVVGKRGYVQQSRVLANPVPVRAKTATEDRNRDLSVHISLLV